MDSNYEAKQSETGAAVYTVPDVKPMVVKNPVIGVMAESKSTRVASLPAGATIDAEPTKRRATEFILNRHTSRLTEVDILGRALSRIENAKRSRPTIEACDVVILDE